MVFKVRTKGGASTSQAEEREVEEEETDGHGVGEECQRCKRRDELGSSGRDP